MTDVYIDTGGTFTDCIIDKKEEGNKYIKVLSDGSIRGLITHKTGAKSYAIEQNWGLNRDILKGYSFSFLSELYTIVSFDKTTALLVLDRKLDKELFPLTVSISAGEEAPILAIRVGMELSLTDPISNINLKLGTTKGTNALLEGKGADVTLLCDKGFADLTLIGTQQRPSIFQLDIPSPRRLFTDVIEIEDSSADFNFTQSTAESYAIALKNAYSDNSNEEELVTKLQETTDKPISVSSRLNNDIKLLNRTQSTLINAYLDPILIQYFNGIKGKLRESQFSVMTSTGTLLRSDLFRSMDSLLSGPAGGLKGAVHIAEALGRRNVITFDMGGTSTDVARYNGSFDYQYRSSIGGFETSIPSLNIETVAAGGGSICYFEDGQLKVGPQSAGASPGPSSYGMGGPLTVTDVNILLGKLHLEAFQFPLNLAAAEEKLRKLCVESHLSREEALVGFEKIANLKMAAAIRKISIRKGFHPKDYSMVSFGGAGGLHACKIAESLGVAEVIFPYASGLLSAYGIGHSAFEKIVSKTVLGTIDSSLSAQFNNLRKEALSALNGHFYVAKQWLSISIKDQEAIIDIDYEENIEIEAEYLRKYSKIYGFYPEGIQLEIRQIHILVSEKLTDKKDTPLHKADSIDGQKLTQAVYKWDDLQASSIFHGPAILYNKFGSVYIAEDWEVALSKDLQAIATYTGTRSINVDENKVINLAVFSNRFQQIAEEMGEQLQKTAFSVNIKERLDFSCGILNENAFLVANAPHIPVHLGSLGMCGRLVLEKLAIEKGDIVITNHPKYGGSHLPDITLIKGVFDADGLLVGYLINRAHHAEIGGSRPGSMPPTAKNLQEEGVVFIPQYLAKNGVFRWSEISTQLSGARFPSRGIDENMADLRAAVASLNAGEESLLSLCDSVGSTVVKQYMERILVNTSEITSKSMQSYSNRKLSAVEKMDDGHEISVDISEKSGKWLFDFTGTSMVHPGNLNANISIVHSAILYVLRLIVAREIPLNDGLMTNVSIDLPPSFLHPHFEDNPALCPAVVGGNTEVSQRLVDTLLKAFGLAACSQGTMNNLLFGNERFGYYETICGGTGATAKQAGRSAVHQHMTNTKITDPEDLERKYPVKIHEFSIRQGSGGQGLHKGGNGVIREIEFLEEVEFTLISQHRVIPPYGLEGGQAGEPGSQVVIRKNESIQHLSGVDQAVLYAGDRIRIETPGGGGWGKQPGLPT